MVATQMFMQGMTQIVQNSTQQSKTNNSDSTNQTQKFDDLLKEKQPKPETTQNESTQKPDFNDEASENEQVISLQSFGYFTQNMQLHNVQTQDLASVNTANTNIMQGANMQVVNLQNPEGELPQNKGEVSLEENVKTQNAQVQTQGEEQAAKTDIVELSSQNTSSEDSASDGENENLGNLQLFKDVKTSPVKVGEAQNLDTTSENFDANLHKAISTADLQGAEKIVLQLSPSTLGNVTVEMSRTPDGALNVILIAENEAAARLINEHSSKLGAMLLNTNAEQVKVEVVQVQESEQSRYEQQDNPNRQSKGNENRQQSQRQNEQNPQDFMQRLRLGIEQIQVSSA